MFNQRGEVLFFVVIVTCAALGLGSYGVINHQSKKDFRKGERIFWNIVQEAQDHFLDHGTYPSTIAGFPVTEDCKAPSLIYFRSFVYETFAGGQSCQLIAVFRNNTEFTWHSERLFSSRKLEPPLAVVDSTARP